MWMWEDVLYASTESEEQFAKTLDKTLATLNISIKDLGDESRIPESTLYKITSGKRRDLKLSSLRAIIKALRKLEEGHFGINAFVAVISDRKTLEELEPSLAHGKIALRAYPATDVVEALIQGVRAERHGARAVVCGPVMAYSLEKTLKIPVIALRTSKNELREAIDVSLHRLRMKEDHFKYP